MLTFLVFLTGLNLCYGQLEGLGFSGVGGDYGLHGLDTQSVGIGHSQNIFSQFNFPGTESSIYGGNGGTGDSLQNRAFGFGGLAGSLLGASLGTVGNIGIPSEESITSLGRAISEGGVPSGDHGEIASPTPHPPPGRQERRVGIATRLIGGGFLSRRR